MQALQMVNHGILVPKLGEDEYPIEVALIPEQESPLDNLLLFEIPFIHLIGSKLNPFLGHCSTAFRQSRASCFTSTETIGATTRWCMESTLCGKVNSIDVVGY